MREQRVRKWRELPFAISMTIVTTACPATGHAQRAPLRYLALGDSYTIGEGVAEDDRWPMQLARVLRADDIPLADPRIIATTGWTTDELSSAIDDAEPLGTWDFVSLLVGVNDQYRGLPLDDYSTAFARLLDRAIGFAGGRPSRVLVLSIPDWGVTRFGAESGRDVATIASDIDACNAIARDACHPRGIAFVDITPVSRAHGCEARMLVDDGLHPSAAMYSEWTARVEPIARRLLAE